MWFFKETYDRNLSEKIRVTWEKTPRMWQLFEGNIVRKLKELKKNQSGSFGKFWGENNKNVGTAYQKF